MLLLYKIGLAVDWLSQNIYWTDDLKNHIAVSRYDGSHFKVLIETDVQSPKSIAVDPHERLSTCCASFGVLYIGTAIFVIPD